jgi:hypothetical protein
MRKKNLLGKPGKDHLGDRDVGGRMILKRLLKK